MTFTANTLSFPNFGDGDVKIVLAPGDTLTLHQTTLVRDSDFFKASLGRWAHNKSVVGEGGERSMRLLELDFDGSDAFPLLIVMTTESTSATYAKKRKQHDGPTLAERYHSSKIISAYKIGFAMMYGLPIHVELRELKEMAEILPAVVDFAGAYGLVDTLHDRINSIIFGRKWDGYTFIAANPFPMLRLACKLKSETIYGEAMKHAVALHHRCGDGERTLYYYNPSYFEDIGEPELHQNFLSHAHSFAEKVDDLADGLLQLHPEYCQTSGVAGKIGMAIFRDWVIENFKGDDKHLHKGLFALAKKAYDISDIMMLWSSSKWHRDVGLRFGHVHRAVESCFHEAYCEMIREFYSEDTARGAQALHIIVLDSVQFTKYFANVHFGSDGYPYEYPWEDNAKVREYRPVLSSTEAG